MREASSSQLVLDIRRSSARAKKGAAKRQGNNCIHTGMPIPPQTEVAEEPALEPLADLSGWICSSFKSVVYLLRDAHRLPPRAGAMIDRGVSGPLERRQGLTYCRVHIFEPAVSGQEYVLQQGRNRRRPLETRNRCIEG